MLGSSFFNSVFIIIYGMGTSSVNNKTVIEHSLLPTDGAVIYECKSGVLSIIWHSQGQNHAVDSKEEEGEEKKWCIW